MNAEGKNAENSNRLESRVVLREHSDLSRGRSNLSLEDSNLSLEDSNLSLEDSNLSRGYTGSSPVVRPEDSSGVVRKVDGDIEPCVQSTPELVLKEESQSNVSLQKEACYNVKTGQNSSQGMRGKMASVELRIGRHCVLDSHEYFETAAVKCLQDMLVA